MKKIFLLALFIAFASCVHTHAQDLLYPSNTSFEKGRVGQMPLYWKMTKSATNLGYIGFLSDETPYHGKYCLKLVNHSFSDTVNQSARHGEIKQNISASPYKTHTVKLSAFIKADIADTGEIFLWANQWNVEKSISTATSKKRKSYSKKWDYFELTFEVDTESKDINYGVSLLGSGNIWIDNLRLEIINGNDLYYDKASKLADYSVENIFSFAEIFSAVSHFYPSSEANHIDWDKLALDAIKYIEQTKDKKILVKQLNEIFNPVLPALRISETDLSSYAIKRTKKALKRLAITKLNRGVPYATNQEMYPVRLTNIYNAQREAPGTLMQTVNLENFEGKTIQFSADVKTQVADIASKAELFIAFENEVRSPIKVKIKEHNIQSKAWKRYTTKIKVPKNTKRAKLGLILMGEGKAWFDNVKLEAIHKKKKKSLAITNQDFELFARDERIIGWQMTNFVKRAGYQAHLYQDASKGVYSVCISSDDRSILTMPKEGQMYSKQLSNGVNFSFPLTLFSDGQGTLPIAKLTNTIKNAKPDKFILSGDDRLSRLVMTIKAWSIIKNFSVSNTQNLDKDSVLKSMLADAALCNNEKEFLPKLEKMIASFSDFQTKLWNIEEEITYYLPVLWDYVAGKLIISKVHSDTKNITIGDQITAINGITIADLIKNNQNQASAGSDLLKTRILLASMREGKKGSQVKLTVLGTDKTTKDLVIKRTLFIDDMARDVVPRVAEIKGNIYYIAMSSVEDVEIKKILQSLKDAKGIILDARGNSLISDVMISLFVKDNTKSFTYTVPEHFAPEWKQTTISQKPRVLPKSSKNIDPSKVVILIDERTFDKAEAFVSVIKDHKICTLIGSQTAGSLGAPANMQLSAQHYLNMSVIEYLSSRGKKLVNHGIEPDILVKASPEGVSKGIDELLEYALEYLRKK